MSEFRALVLGAGASEPYGFPIGGELREKIIGHEPINYRTSPDEEANRSYFKEIFSKSEMYSIDAFLTCRPEFSQLGKDYISEILLQYEAARTPSGNWYQYLWNHYRTPTLDELDFSSLKIVTFNYDRSLEYFLLNAILNTYGKGEKVSIERLMTLEVVHVYGSLGPIWDSTTMSTTAGEKIIPFGSPRLIRNAAQNIRVIPDERADKSPEFEHARKILSEANHICFLGFGFDSTNLTRLDSRQTCSIIKPQHAQLQFPPERSIFASAYMLTPKECARHMTNTAGRPPRGIRFSEDMDDMPYGFKSAKSLETLRHTDFLHLPMN